MEDKKSGVGKFGSVRPRKKAVSNVDNEEFSTSSSRRSFGDRKPFDGERGERKTFGGRKPFGGRKFGDRPFNDEERGERKPYGERAERRSFGDRKPFDGERGERKSFGGRKPFDGERGERKSFGGRKPFGGRKFGDRPFNDEERGERKPYGERAERRSFGDRKPFDGERGERRSFGGDRKPYGRRGESEGRPYRGYASRQDDMAAKRGMDNMLSKRSKVDDQYSDNDMVDIPVKDVVRLNKYIANSGICSRREADKYIEAGVVTVNGQVVTELGAKVNVNTDDIRFNGERLHGEDKVYIIMNKPKGYVTTSADPHADKTVLDLLTGCPARVFAVGRLDKNTTGVLMFTNDGEISEKLTHPSYDKKKIYQVTLDHDLRKDDFDTILNEGVTLVDGVEKADDLQYIDEGDHRKLGIEIHSGKNRVVRRIFETLGYDVKALDRVYFAGLTKSGLKKGAWRFLTEGEVNILKMGAYK